MEFKELVSVAKQKVGFRKLTDYCSVGLVSCAILADNGKVYTGLNIDCDCGIGFCAEHSAISKMLEDGESRIIKIVALSEQKIFPPCGRCREFMRLINFQNLNAEIMVSENEIVTLRDLLPHSFEK